MEYNTWTLDYLVIRKALCTQRVKAGKSTVTGMSGLVGGTMLKVLDWDN